MVKPIRGGFFMKKNKITFYVVFQTAISTLFFTLLNACLNGRSFLSVSLLNALLYLGTGALSTSISFILSFLINFNLNKTFCAVVSTILIVPIYALLKKKKIKVGAKIILLSLLSTLPFLVLSNLENQTLNLIQGSVSIVLSLVFISSSRVVYVKRFNYKPQTEELVCLAVFTFLVGVGFINLLGFYAYRSVVIFILLCSLHIFGGGSTAIVSCALAIPPSTIALDLNYFACFLLISVLSAVFYKKSKFLSALVTLAVDVVFLAVFNLYGTFIYLDVLYSVIPVCIFLFLPISIFERYKKKAFSLKEKLLPRYAINRMRLTISGKLYDMAGVFNEMKQGFEKLKSSVTSGEDLFGRMADEVMLSVCESCPSFSRCNQKGMPNREELIKIISVGVAKNRVSLIDLTKIFAENCGYLNSIIFEINSLIGKYREKVKELDDISSGKELITMQADGVSGVLKNMALDFSKSLSFTAETEKKVCDALQKNGISYLEIMALGSDDGIEINLIMNPDNLNVTALSLTVSNALGIKMNVTSKTAISINLCSVTLRPAPLLDAAFGLAYNKKHGSVSSGDTHALTKIDEGSFLIALSDGMGSGIGASQTSSTAISLIESFYKAGLESKVVLGMVNKVLALNTDDNFSAIDVLTVDLFNQKGDFIKIGSPASYLITKDSIQIIEGNSLPLGILDDLKPTGVSIPIEEGATILMVTDGVSDAFGSSTDFISYLKTLKTLNPQRLADDLISKAVCLDDDEPKDDMTVLAIRIFKKAS